MPKDKNTLGILLNWETHGQTFIYLVLLLFKYLISSHSKKKNTSLQIDLMSATREAIICYYVERCSRASIRTCKYSG